MAGNYTIATVDINCEKGNLIRVEFRVYEGERLLETFGNRDDANEYVQSLIEQEQNLSMRM